MFKVEIVCPFCGGVNYVNVFAEDLAAWKKGDLNAQDAFPYLNANERELLISGICDTCWNELFGGEE